MSRRGAARALATVLAALAACTPIVSLGRHDASADSARDAPSDAPGDLAPPDAPPDAPSDTPSDVTPRMPLPLDAVSNVALGLAHTCAVSAGLVGCWGANDRGQLGDGTTVDQPRPTVVAGLVGPADALALGAAHTCALHGVAFCWGANDRGQLGDGTMVDRRVPVTVTPVPGVAWSAMAAGDAHTCLLGDDARVYCFGDNTQGQLGDGSAAAAARATPGPVAALTNVAHIAAGARHACAVLRDGGLWCWGEGYGAVPTAVSTGTPAALDVVAGRCHDCAVFAGVGIQCWGCNDRGQLGDGTTTPAPRPMTTVATIPTVGIASGRDHVCAVGGDYSLCWGAGTEGQLGDPTHVTDGLRPLSILGRVTTRQIAAGGRHSCALLQTTELWCWGDNARGQLGDGTTTQRTSPTQIR